jgi:hypothetical protein
MTKLKLGVTAAAGVLMFGVAGYAAAASVQHDATAKNIVVAADDNATDDNATGDDSAADDDSAAGDDDSDSAGSAKMGTDEGTHVGEDQGANPEDDTDKIDQPARRNPTTGDAADEQSDDVMPPDEDEDSDQPQ